MSAKPIYLNSGASCPTCLYQEDALKGNMDAKRRCKKCSRTDERTEWDPKPGVKVQYGISYFRYGDRLTRTVIP